MTKRPYLEMLQRQAHAKKDGQTLPKKPMTREEYLALPENERLELMSKVFCAPLSVEITDDGKLKINETSSYKPKPEKPDDLPGPSNDHIYKTEYDSTPIKKVDENAKTFSEVKFTNSARQAKYEANLRKAEKMRAETLAELAKERKL